MKRFQVRVLFASFLLACSFPALAQTPFSLAISPAVNIPLSDSSQYFNLGGALEVNLRYQFPQTMYFVQGGLNYAYSPTPFGQSLSLATADVGAGIRFPLASIVSLLAYARGGYWYGTYNDMSMSSTNPFVAGGAGVQVLLSPTFSFEAGGQYQYYAGLYQGVSVGVGMTIALGGGSRSAPTVTPSSTPRTPGIQFRPTFFDAFPVLYRYYDDHPIGQLEIENNTNAAVSNVRVQFYISQYMDEPKVMDFSGSIAPGDKAQVNLCAPLTDTVLTVTKGINSAAELVIDYEANGQSHTEKKVATMRFLGRNAMTWDDSRKAAAYVTAEDAQVLAFARSVTSSVQNSETRSIDQNIQAAIALHEALDLYGLNYVSDRMTPYSEASKQKNVIDSLWFPRETLQLKSGDCSDISILYSALLQAVGVDTAFLTIPGHIFVAFTTNLTPEQASASLIPASEYIAYQGKVWIPVEITTRYQGFLKAWERGAKEWHEANATGQAGFCPIQDAWKVFQPVELPGTAGQVAAPAAARVLAAYRAITSRYVDTAIYPQIQKLQSETQSSSSPSAINRLGVLYAKYGYLDKAEREFEEALTLGIGRPYLPAILNLGNLYFIQGKWKRAMEYYQDALHIDSLNPHVLLAIVKVDRQLGSFDDMKQKYDQLKQLDPKLADEYAYLGQGADSGATASDIAAERRTVLWEGQ